MTLMMMGYKKWLKFFRNEIYCITGWLIKVYLGGHGNQRWNEQRQKVWKNRQFYYFSFGGLLIFRNLFMNVSIFFCMKLFNCCRLCILLCVCYCMLGELGDGDMVLKSENDLFSIIEFVLTNLSSFMLIFNCLWSNDQNI